MKQFELSKEEFELFQKMKQFIIDWADEEISSGDACDYLSEFAEALGCYDEN